MSDLLKLAERVEAATGPSVRLDVQIEIAVNPDRRCIIGNKPGKFPQEPIYGALSDFWQWALEEDKEPPVIQCQPYTASLDAAMTLVPEGWAIDDLMIWPGASSYLKLLETTLRDGEYWHDARSRKFDATAATPALALCAAALRARAASLISAAGQL